MTGRHRRAGSGAVRHLVFAGRKTHTRRVRIAHLSDLHLLDLEGAVPFRLLNKRLTGYLNLRFHRKSVHKPFAAEAAARAIRRLDVDHVVITGDVSNLALEREFERVRRFEKTFAKYLQSDIDVAEDGPFPYVKLRGPAAIIGLSTARPRPPFMASGSLGRAQVAGLGRALAHPEVARRTVVLLQHHPWHHKGRLHLFLEGLWDAGAEATALRQLSRGLLLHGHQHRRIRREIATERGHIDAIGVTSASLIHESDERMAGFNVYEIRDDGAVGQITSHRLDGKETFVEVQIPRG